jgi:hypothetical protein
MARYLPVIPEPEPTGIDALKQIRCSGILEHDDTFPQVAEVFRPLDEGIENKNPPGATYDSSRLLIHHKADGLGRMRETLCRKSKWRPRRFSSLKRLPESRNAIHFTIHQGHGPLWEKIPRQFHHYLARQTSLLPKPEILGKGSQTAELEEKGRRWAIFGPFPC